MMQEERQRFARELDHYYSFQKKCNSNSSPERDSVDAPQRGHRHEKERLNKNRSADKRYQEKGSLENE